jgi:D-specific alpha-keto acid dehydrogenase
MTAGNHCVSVDHKTPIDVHVLLALRDAGVRYLSTRSVGYDHIDLDCAQRLGISVENVAYSPHSVADYTLMLMLMAVRDVTSTVNRSLERDYRPNERRGRELRDLTVGVVGTGRIGAAVIDRLSGFGCHILAHDRCPKIAVEYVRLADLLQRSDVVTLHTPLTPDTHHLLDNRRLAQMQTGAFVINTGRGALIDTAALLSSLEDGRLGGAALDVVEGEKGIFYLDHRMSARTSSLLSRLQQLPNVIITPHAAYFTEHALYDVVENTITNCLNFEESAR